MKMKDFEGTTIIFDEEYNPPQTDMEKWKEYGLKSFYLLKQIEMITGGTDEEGEVTKKEYENIAPFLEMLKEIKTPVKVAVMGCEVNGPGEAKDADVGIAAGAGKAIIFRKGKKSKIVNEDEMLTSLIQEIKSVEKEMQKIS